MKKELSTEEKARAYDEAKARISKAFNDNKCTIGFMNEIFPELAESEDERIRKALIEGFKVMKDGSYGECTFSNYNIPVTAIIAWLEKQGKNNMGISESVKQKLEDNLNKALEKETPESWNKFIEKQGEQKPAWSEEDERIYQSIMDDTVQENQLDGKQIDWLRDIKYRHFSQPQNTWKPSDKQIMALRWVLNHIPYNSHKEEISGLFEQLKKLREE